MTRPLFVLIVLVAFGGVAALVGSRFLAAEPPQESASRPADSLPAQAPARPPSEAQVPDLEPELKAAPQTEPTSQRELAQGVVAEPSATACTLRVVEGTSEQARPDARVYFVGIDGPPWEHPAWDLDTGEAWLEEHGETVQLDGTGSGTFDPEQHDHAILVASAAGMWARSGPEIGSQETYLIELEPDVNLRARVVDEGGNPVAGMPVSLRRRRSSWKTDRRVGPTGADGRRTLRHVAGELESRDSGRRSIAVAAVLAEPVEFPFEVEDPPSEEVLLSVPATGSVEVHVQPMPGGPPVGESKVELMLHEEGSEERPSFWNRPETIEAELVDGVALFQHVGLGLQLDVSAKGERSNRATRASGPGPLSPGEQARIDVTLGSDHPVLRMRVLAASGDPLRNKALQVSFALVEEDDDANQTEKLTTDGEGVLWYDYPRFVPKDSEAKLTIQRESVGGEGGGRVQVQLARTLVDGLNDFGDVTLGASQVLASGRVLRADGSPVQGAQVRVFAVHDREGGPLWYEYMNGRDDTADAEGRFEILGTASTERVRLTAKEGDWVVTPEVVPVGTTGIQLNALEAGKVRGRVLVDESIDPRELRVQMKFEDELENSDWTSRGRSEVNEDGTFTIKEVLPGTYALDVSPNRTSDELAVIEGILVTSGATTNDPRLDPIDLRGLLNCFEVVVVPPKSNDSIVGVLQIDYVDRDGEEVSKTQFMHGASTSVCFPVDRVDIGVHVLGFRSAQFANVSEDIRLELERGIPVRLRLAGDVELPKPPSYLKAFLSSAEKSPSWSMGHFQDQVFDEQGELLVYAGVAGMHEINWLLETRSENSLTTSSIRVEEPQLVEIVDLAGEQVIDALVPTEELAERLGNL